MERVLHVGFAGIVAFAVCTSACGGAYDGLETEASGRAAGQHSLTVQQSELQNLEITFENVAGTRYARIPIPEANPVYRDMFGDCQPGSGAGGLDIVYIAEMFKCAVECGGPPCGLEDGQGGCELGCHCGGGLECEPYDGTSGTGGIGGAGTGPGQTQGL